VSANGYLFDALSRHQLLIQRLASGQVKETLPILKRMQRDIRASLASRNLTDFQAARLQTLQAEINAITREAGAAISEKLIPNMQQFAIYEAQFTQKALQGAVTVQLAGVNAAALSSSVATSGMALVSGKKIIKATIPQMLDTFAAGASREVMTAVQSGITMGQTTNEIVNQVMGLVSNRTKAQAEAVVRTAANQVGSMARAELYKANKDVLKGEEYSAVLDGRTTITCMGLDGHVYPVGEGPMPPMHYGCRSVRIPRVKSAFAALREGSTRASMTGPVSSQTTYNSWLGRQSKEFQVEVLGVERAELFRSGGLTLSKFTDEAGRVYTLDELKAREGLTL
jgi:SPP1 gp7 family putative phage head morphogenesis protein